MVDVNHLGSMRDVAVSGAETSIIRNWGVWGEAAQTYDCCVIAQLWVKPCNDRSEPMLQPFFPWAATES